MQLTTTYKAILICGAFFLIRGNAISKDIFTNDKDWAHCDWSANKSFWVKKLTQEQADTSNANWVEASWVMQYLELSVEEAIKQFKGQGTKDTPAIPDLSTFAGQQQYLEGEKNGGIRGKNGGIYSAWKNKKNLLLNKIEKANTLMRFNPGKVDTAAVKQDIIDLLEVECDTKNKLGTSSKAIMLVMTLARYDFARMLWNCSTHKHLDAFYDISAQMREFYDAKDYAGLKKFLRGTYLKYQIIPVGTWQLIANPPAGAVE